MANETQPDTAASRATRLIQRRRLVTLLRGRFDHRLTLVTGAAGFGKTTALVQAVENNRLDPVGSDVSITVSPSATSARALVGSLADALDVAASTDTHDTLSAVCDAVWSLAPDDVALLVDDAHLLDPDAVDVLRRLVVELPANGHLVVGSRHPIALAVARLRAHDTLLEIDESDLSLDDGELVELAQRSGRDEALDLPRHVATADLRLAAGVGAGADFMWEEILSALDDDRLDTLRRCAVVDRLDDDLVEAMSDGSHDTGTLLTGLPLVEWAGDVCRLHAILREALLARLDPSERRKAVAIAAEARARRGEQAVAVRLYDEADDPVSALDAARDFVVSPLVVQTIDDVVSTRRIVERIDPDGAVRAMLDALAHLDGLDTHVSDRFTHAAAVARDRGDVRIETAALRRTITTQMLHHDPAYKDSLDRLGRLAEVDEVAAGIQAYVSAIVAQVDGRSDESLDAIEHISGIGGGSDLTMRAERLYDLGRAELVAVGLTGDDLAEMQPVATAFLGLAMWFRGDSSPETSLPFARAMVENTLRSRYSHLIVSALASATVIALAAGETTLAARYANHAEDVASTGVGATIGEGVLVAKAGVIAAQGDDDEATEMLRREGPSFGYPGGSGPAWPTRSQLLALPLTYLARPDLRAMFDRIDVGFSAATAIAAGRALVELRSSNDPSGAASLPWSRTDLLRAHLLPHHLVELACAAISAGHDEAAAVLDVVPDRDRHLVRTAGTDTVAADVAIDLLGSAPRPEPFTLHAAVLGPVVLERDGEVVTASAFQKRPKVRELFALLVERRRLTRTEVVGILWPDHDDEDKALGSLRTSLSTLNDVLDPTRSKGASAFHLDIDADSVAFDPRVSTDVTEFEELLDAARADDDAGLPARALVTYERALELYRGDYLHGIDAPWIVLTRLRLRSLAINATCRVAELVAARGEPENASRWAARARTLDPLNERAGRLFVAALDAAGDRTAAREAAAELRSVLDEADLEPSAATRRLLDRVG